jgi:heparan-alpha-glucosaminide N-acetyltransferase
MYHNTGPNGEAVSAATCAALYGCRVYDPEGFMGYFTSSTMAFLGLTAGRVIVHHKRGPPGGMLRRWVVWGLGLCAIGIALCGASKNEGAIPLNKNLWSPSFIVIMAGTGNLMLATHYALIDYFRVWNGLPFRWVGMNSILVYAGSEILQGYAPFTIMDHVPDNSAEDGDSFGSHSGSLTSNVFGVLCWIFVAWYCNRIKFWVKL